LEYYTLLLACAITVVPKTKTRKRRTNMLDAGF
jgi:hypothetical protein